MAKAKPRTHKLRVIEDKDILAMARNSQFTSRFPFLKNALNSANKPAAQCGTCSGSRTVVKKNIRNLNDVKVMLAKLPREKKSQLKALLDTKEGRIVFRDGNTVKKLTF